MFAYSAILLEKEDHTSGLFRLERGSLGSFAKALGMERQTDSPVRMTES